MTHLTLFPPSQCVYSNLLLSRTLEKTYLHLLNIWEKMGKIKDTNWQYILFFFLLYCNLAVSPFLALVSRNLFGARTFAQSSAEGGQRFLGQSWTEMSKQIGRTKYPALQVPIDGISHRGHVSGIMLSIIPSFIIHRLLQLKLNWLE